MSPPAPPSRHPGVSGGWRVCSNNSWSAPSVHIRELSARSAAHGQDDTKLFFTNSQTNFLTGLIVTR